MSKHYVITQENAQKIMDYIGSRPYKEVFQLVAILQNLVPIEEKVQEVTKEEDIEKD